jgi:hypothetical protein
VSDARSLFSEVVMLQFAITNLQVSDQAFEIPSALGKWEFNH